jgi:branched-chain amino acid transport system substrate-binding protein
VVGHTGSAQTLDAANVYADADGGGRRALVAVTPTATNPVVTRASEWIFRVCPTDHDAARALARFAAESLGARRVAVIYRNDLFGRGFTRTFRREFETADRTIIERDPYLAGVTEFAAYTARIARRGADALVIAGGSEDAVEIVRRLRALGAGLPVLGSDDLAGLASDPTLAREFRAVRFTAFYRPDAAAAPEALEFAAAYARRFGRPPDHRAALSYDAAMLIGLAALEAGPDRRAVRDRLARVGRDAPAHEGVTGRIRFDEWGDAVDKPVIVARVGPP